MVLFGHTKQATSAKTSLTYLTVGALTIVWTVIWYIYLRNNGASQNAYLWVYGFMATGVVLLIIGAGVGTIGRASMPAETAPTAGVTGIAGAAAVPGAAGAPVAGAVPAAVPPAAGGMPPAGADQQVANVNTVPPAPVAPAQARRV
jgi:hypothetical protein